jgi:hypothetical protein
MSDFKYKVGERVIVKMVSDLYFCATNTGARIVGVAVGSPSDPFKGRFPVVYELECGGEQIFTSEDNLDPAVVTA